MKKYLVLGAAFALSQVNVQFAFCENDTKELTGNSQDRNEEIKAIIEELKSLCPEIHDCVKMMDENEDMVMGAENVRNHYFSNIAQMKLKIEDLLKNPGEIHPDFVKYFQGYEDSFRILDQVNKSHPYFLSFLTVMLTVNRLKHILNRDVFHEDPLKISAKKSQEEWHKKSLEEIEKEYEYYKSKEAMDYSSILRQIEQGCSNFDFQLIMPNSSLTDVDCIRYMAEMDAIRLKDGIGINLLQTYQQKKLEDRKKIDYFRKKYEKEQEDGMKVPVARGLSRDLFTR